MTVGIVNSETETEWMTIHVATLFDCDADGRIRSLRRPWSRPGDAPRFFMGRTLEGNVWRFRHDLPDDVVRELEVLCRSEPRAKRLARPPRNAGRIRTAIQAHGPITGEYRGPAYLIPEGPDTPIDAVRVTKENVHVLETGFPWMVPPIMSEADIGPVTAAVVGSNAVSICYCARLSPLGAEAGVQTLEPMRGKGHATNAVAAWAAAIRRQGLLPLYSASWENVASQRVANKLGMACYGEDWEIE